MLISQFVAACHTTKDTVRFYVEAGLLKPTRHGRNFWYTDQDQEDFQQVQELAGLGFAIADIQRIRAMHDAHCGTAEQRRLSRQLVARELSRIEVAQANLLRQQQALLAYQKALDA